MVEFRTLLKEVMSYDVLSGVFTRIATGKQCVSLTNDGYVVVHVFGEKFLAHRLAWFYVHGKWPVGDLDHKNTIKNDNSFENLREATHTQNMQNTSLSKRNKTGVKGVSFHKASGKYQAEVMCNGVKQYKLFKTIVEAGIWLKDKREALHGEFHNHGKENSYVRPAN